MVTEKGDSNSGDHWTQGIKVLFTLGEAYKEGYSDINAG
jgi:hypothetical protein